VIKNVWLFRFLGGFVLMGSFILFPFAGVLFAGDDGMVPVPAGEFKMGGPKKHDGKPIHAVHVDGFRIDKFEVTQKEFEQVMGNNPSRFKGEKRPVDSVTWKEASEYCEKAGKRLPSEAEWEYAARAGGKDDGYGGYWYKGNSRKESHPVGEKKANALGIYDMLGNVWEWTADWFDADYYKASPRENPKGPESGTERVVRGGSWGGAPLTVRAFFRLKLDPATQNHSVGFRCASSGASGSILL